MMGILKNAAMVAGFVLLAVTLSACANPEEKAADYISSGNTFFEEGNLPKAEIEYKNALQINQNLPDAWYGLARIHERNQAWRETYATLNRVRELAPQHLDSRIMLGQLLLASNQVDQALTDATEILEQAPGDARAHALMAAVQFRLQNYEAAQGEVDRTLEIDPANPEAILVRARILIAEDKYDEALSELDKSLAAEPRNVSMHLMKIQAFQQMRDAAAIENTYRELVELFPDNKAFKQALVRLYLGQERIDAAEQIIQQIAEDPGGTVEDKIQYVSFKRQYRSMDDAIALTRRYIDSESEQYRFRFLLAEIYERDGQQDKTIDIYQSIVSDAGLDANGIEAQNKLALIQMRTGNADKARQLVDEILTQDASSQDALLLRAGFQMSEQKFDDALVSLRTVLRDNPDSIKALGLLAQTYAATGSRELAIESYDKAFKLNPGAAVIANQYAGILLRQRKFDQASEILQQSFERGNRSVDAVKLMTQANLALGEWDQAERLARQLEQVEGQEAISQQALGAVFLGREQQAESIEAFRRAHELAPGAAQPMVSLVRTYLQAGQRAEARSFLDSVIKGNPDNLSAHLLLGQLNLIENKPDAALEHFARMVDISPNLELGYRNQAAVYRRTGDLGKAEAILKQGLQANPKQLTLKMTLASIYEVQGRFADAIDTYESLLASNDDLIVARNNLASLLTDYGGDEASLERARSLSAGFKDSAIPQFRDTYAWALVRSGTNLEEAVVILEKIVKDNDSEGVYKFHLGEAYRKKGDMENAQAYLQLAAEQLPPGSDLAEQANSALQSLN